MFLICCVFSFFELVNFIVIKFEFVSYCCLFVCVSACTPCMKVFPLKFRVNPHVPCPQPRCHSKKLLLTSIILCLCWSLQTGCIMRNVIWFEAALRFSIFAWYTGWHVAGKLSSSFFPDTWRTCFSRFVKVWSHDVACWRRTKAQLTSKNELSVLENLRISFRWGGWFYGYSIT